MVESHFYVDEQGFCFVDENIEAIESALASFATTVGDMAVDEAALSCWSQIWEIESQSGRTLSTILWTNSEIDPYLRRRVGNILDKAANWDDGDDASNIPLEVEINGSVLALAPSIAFCRRQRLNGNHAALITTNQASRQGLIDVRLLDDSNPITLDFLSEVIDVIRYWRRDVEFSDYSVAELQDICPIIFRSLRFADGIWGQFNRFSGEYRSVRRQLMRDLIGLNDYILKIRRDFTDPHRIAAELRSVAGVNCSPESPLTRANRAAMNARDVVFEGKSVRCEWHSKLEPHRNRIHFAVFSDFVLIGVFAEHLPT